MKLIRNILSDPSAYIFKALHIATLFLIYHFSTLLSKLIMLLKGVKIGMKVKFWSIPIIYRVPGSKIEIGSNCVFRSSLRSNLIGINHKCIISTQLRDSSIVIGNNCGFSGTAISSSLDISIGNNVLIGANVVITDFDWHSERYPSEPKPIRIENNVWIGLNVIILKGVTIGENSVIAAGSVVTSNIPPFSLAGGNPCKVIKSINEN
jgi:acetyltransferase-like isoleucine patch superfamily enzyme